MGSTPAGTEGYEKAEVTARRRGHRRIVEQTMECLKVKGLFFIGEVSMSPGISAAFNFSGLGSGAAAAAPYEETGARRAPARAVCRQGLAPPFAPS